MPRGAAVMSWRGTAGGIAAATAGHDVVMSPGSHCYLDHSQSVSPDQPKSIGGFTPLSKVHAFDPVPPALNEEKSHHILGGQGNVWTEYMPVEKQVDYMVWPRAIALAEALWSPKARPDFSDFSRRLPEHLDRLKSAGVQYFVDPHPGSFVVGEWKAGQLSTTAAIHEWPITVPIHGGVFDIDMQFTGGAHRAEFAWVAVKKNGVEISRDTHAGVTGAVNKANRYRLDFGPADPAAKFTIAAETRTDGGTDSHGRIVMWPA